MRVLLPCLDFPPAIGGIQTMLASLAAELGEWDLTVIAPAHPEAAALDRMLPYHVVRAPGLPLGSQGKRYLAGVALQTLRLALARRPDLLYLGHPLLGPVGLLLKRMLGLPYLVQTYDTECRQRLVKPVLPAVFREAVGVLTISAYNADVVAAHGCPRERIRRLPVGYNPERMARVTPSNLPDRLGLTGKPWLLTVSRLDDEYKGIDTALQALPLMRRHLPDLRYVVAGDGRLRAGLEAQARELGLAESVLFLGRVPEEDLAALYRDCSAFILLSREHAGGAEGFGLVFLEAAAWAKASLGGASGGIPDAVLDGETGLLCNPTDPQAVANAALRLLTDPALSRRLGERGRERTLNELTWTASAAELRRIAAEAVGPLSPLSHAPAPHHLR